MDLATFQSLLTSTGQRALADAQALAPAEPRFLACFQALRKTYEDGLAKAALETVLLRTKARARFAAADTMYFTRESLEQASGEEGSSYRAKRFVPYGVVADLCCGVGGDALSLARAGLTVHAVDLDPLRLAMLEANAAALGVSDRVRLHCLDVINMPLPDVSAAFADPSRRSEARRHLNPEDYTPPLSAIRAGSAKDFPLAVKIAPGVSWGDLHRVEAEVEFVSVDGEMKECILWFGQLRTSARRATVLPEGATLQDDKPIEATEPPPVTLPKRYLYDPDPAMVRAGLAGKLAAQFAVSTLDGGISLFTSDRPMTSPFWKGYEIEDTLSHQAGVLKDYLRSKQVGRITPIKRGSTVDSDELLKKLRLKGDEHRVLFLTRSAGKELVLICQPLST